MILNNKVALVTGATRGIGKAIALELGKKGAVVIGTSTSQKGADSIEEYLKYNQIEGKGLILDVSSIDSVNQMFKYINEHLGFISILVNNAGITKDTLLLRMTDDKWFDVINTNLNSIYRLSKSVLKHMVKTRFGRIINMGSVVGASGNSGQVNYAASKAGIEGFSKSLAKEVGSRNITVNVVSPGFIETDMTNVLSDEQKSTLIKQIPIGRLGKVEDIAKVVAFIASDEASYITGAIIPVNGGMYM